jgi:hypothetical protein
VTHRTLYTRGLPGAEGILHDHRHYTFTLEKWAGKAQHRVRIPGGRRDREGVEPAEPEQAAFLDALGLKRDLDCCWRVPDVDGFTAELDPCRDDSPPVRPVGPREPLGVRVENLHFRGMKDATTFLEGELAAKSSLMTGADPGAGPGIWLGRVVERAPAWRAPLRRWLLHRYRFGEAVDRPVVLTLATSDLVDPDLLIELLDLVAILTDEEAAPVIAELERLAQELGWSWMTVALYGLNRPALAAAGDRLRALQTGG